MLDVRGTSGGVLGKNGDAHVLHLAVTGTAQVWRQDGPQAVPGAAHRRRGPHDRRDVAPDDSVVVVSAMSEARRTRACTCMSPDGGPLALIQHTPKVQTARSSSPTTARRSSSRANDIEPRTRTRSTATTSRRRQASCVFDHAGLWSDRGPPRRSLVDAEGHRLTSESTTTTSTSKTLTPLLGVGETEAYDVAVRREGGPAARAHRQARRLPAALRGGRGQAHGDRGRGAARHRELRDRSGARADLLRRQRRRITCGRTCWMRGR